MYKLPEDWGSDKDLLDNCFNIADLAISDYHNNPDPKFTPDDEEYKLLNRCYSLWLIADFQDTTTNKVASSYVAGSVIEWFNRKITPQKDSSGNIEPFPLKYVAFSAHDANIAPFLYEMGLLNTDCLL